MMGDSLQNRTKMCPFPIPYLEEHLQTLREDYAGFWFEQEENLSLVLAAGTLSAIELKA